jgi:uncharacterized zinc-type alcohol dehydrogenase-like protein
MPPRYPCVPGHELAGVCVAVGAAVTRFRVGDHVGVGCMVDSCLTCAACLRGEEQMCLKNTNTYCAKPSARAGVPPGAPSHTLGGYTSVFVVHERFGIKIPAGYPLQAAGPVMCAGVTLFDPLRRYGAGPSKRVAIVGVGGLGAIGIKIAKAMGAHVTAITRSLEKAAFAKAACGADATLLSSDAGAMRAHGGAFDLVLDTVPAEHDYWPYVPLLEPARGALVHLGLNTALVAGIAVDKLTCGASRIKGSGIGGIEATQAVIDLCAAKNIVPELEVIKPEGIAAAYEALVEENQSGKRYVIDLASLKDGSAEAACKDVSPPRFKVPKQPSLGLVSVVGAILRLWCCCGWRRRAC